MADAFQWVSQNTDAARQQALAGRDYVEATWSRGRAFAAVASALKESSGRSS
jgi:hypothetical protein